MASECNERGHPVTIFPGLPHAYGVRNDEKSHPSLRAKRGNRNDE